MKSIAVEYPAQGQMRLADIGQPPEPKANEILIETEFSGITNGTERHALMGEHGWKGAYPSKHGYQQVGRIAAIGTDVKQFAVDERVFFGQYVGHRGWNIVNVSNGNPASNASHLVCKLPETLDPREAALLGVMGVGMRGVRRFRIRPAQKVWVAGMGLIGLGAAQAARLHGAHVTVSDIADLRLDAARACGAHRIVDARDADHWERLKAGGPYDCIIDCSGVARLPLEVHEKGLLASRGVLGLLAVRSETAFHWSMLHIPEASIEVSCHFSLDDLRVILYGLQQRTMHIKPLIKHVMPIAKAPEVYRTLQENPGELLGVVFDWTE